jgi:hypothetical protein
MKGGNARSPLKETAISMRGIRRRMRLFAGLFCALRGGNLRFEDSLAGCELSATVKNNMNANRIVMVCLALIAMVLRTAAPALAQEKKPNIIFIMGDDIGWSNIGVYNQGIMAGRTPNLDKLATEGMRFTDYYAEASCTAGRANFITGELPIRTGLTTVCQAGSPLGIPDQAPTIATALKSMGYATGQFGKNHLGDRNQFLPTVHGFDEFSATCTTLMRWRTRAIATIRKR